MKNPLNVLMVEDDEDDCELVLRALESGGCRVAYTRVQTASAMKEALVERDWDLVLSDYSMPQFSAPAALRVLKESGVDIPFIIVSGTVGEDVAVEALKAGAHDFMLKSRLTRLCPAIDRELRELQARRLHREAEDARRAAEARFRAIMEAATDAVIAANSSGHILYVNPAAETMFGYNEEQLLGKRFGDLILARGLPVEAGLESSDLHALGGPGEVMGRRSDGSEFPVDVSFSAWTTRNERHFAGIVRDITDRKKVEAQLLVADRMVAVGTLAAGVAHEINNPLAAVIANLDLVLQEVTRTADDAALSTAATALQDELRDAREAATRVRHIVRDLKIFSRGESEERGPVDVRRVLESTLRMAWNEIRHRAKLVKDYSDVPPVEGSEARLGQVFLNLLVNAAQALPEGQSERHEIRVKTWAKSERVFVEISDTGCGIPPQVMQRLFTPFVTTKPVGVGTGLGLSICHRIVTSLGGEISADSEPGMGTSFRISLPCTHRELAAAPTSRAPVVTTTRRGKVLVVDDEATIARALNRALAREHEVTLLQRAGVALQRIVDGERFDVILCDLMMPEMTGMELYAELHRQVPEQAARIVFLTGGAFTSSARAFLDGVANPRLEKPFDVVQIRAIVNERVV